ncbi:alpha-D-ribose 1-methylphosphonate 5-triphosphate diphosphatase [Pseudorhizobium tarimense]|uniref:Alpha-D-ribose 1-methylphosphonate 5-triphosphate diphosphatase n=1 Tax=Pseudorhizobium tarimense TaxID=1079109 RepID=A0ABV2H6P6_9HYPH|nr:alpha-D-ribose 1-methylphosphonate 5-triphosphate diphosphatase [Pseudorhizobium tarimense]MCJ8519467.1 alpha-D-ribose 1-methylphosphonate 5-triphosphate diphosphatase [Pseudorhizobium tarimense]
MNWTIRGGRALVAGQLTKSDIQISDGRLVAAPADEARLIAANGLLVLPGIVDIHGDGFERQLMPRPGVRFDTALALRDTDRQLVANGITTAFHGVTISWEPGLRSVEAAIDLVETLMEIRPSLRCDTRLHLRWETFALDQLPTVMQWLSLNPKPIVALNDHTTGTILKGTIARKIGQMASRSGLSHDEYRDLLDSVWARRGEVPAAIEELAAAAKLSGNVLLAHDEASPEEREAFRKLGAVTSEFPLTRETAEAARAAGEEIVLGAPNVVRGGSHNGALDATQAVRDGLCTVLTSDYHYPSPLHAAFKLAGADLARLGSSWPLVSANAAKAAGLADRGELQPGKRADLILVDAADPSHPQVMATMVAGRMSYSAGIHELPMRIGASA